MRHRLVIRMGSRRWINSHDPCAWFAVFMATIMTTAARRMPWCAKSWGSMHGQSITAASRTDWGRLSARDQKTTGAHQSQTRNGKNPCSVQPGDCAFASHLQADISGLCKQPGRFQMSHNIKVDIVVIPGYVHQIDSVQIQPETNLSHWQLIKVRDKNGNFSRHLAGRRRRSGINGYCCLGHRAPSGNNPIASMFCSAPVGMLMPPGFLRNGSGLINACNTVIRPGHCCDCVPGQQRRNEPRTPCQPPKLWNS